MNENISKQWIKSAAAVVCAASICISIFSISNKISDTVRKTATVAGATNSRENVTSETNQYTETAGEDVTDANIENVDVPQESTDTTESLNQNSSGGSAISKTVSSKTTVKSTSGVPTTKSEIISYCNNALNAVKSSKAGYTKKYVMQAKGNTSGIPSFVTKLVTKDKTTKMAKGSNSNDDFPAAGFSWSSKLREQDVKEATLKRNGDYYEITLKLGTEKNPAKGEKSSYGRIMSVIDANDAKNMLSGIKSVTMTYHDGYVIAKINSKTGRVTFAEMSATADVAATISLLGDISITDIVSTETYTDFIF